MIAGIAKEYDLQAISLRLHNVYGPGDQRPKIINLLSKAVDHKAPLDTSPGHQVLDFVHVLDVCRAYEKAVLALLHGKVKGHVAFEVGSGKGVTIRELASLISQALSIPLYIRWGGRSYAPGEVMHRVADLKPIVDALGWNPEIEVQTGLSDILGKRV